MMKENINEFRKAWSYISSGEGLAKKGKRFFARVWKNGKRTWRSTGTGKLHLARRWKEKWDNEQFNRQAGIESKGTQLDRTRLLVEDVVQEYIDADCPIIRKRSLKAKAPRSIAGEKYCFRPVLDYFGKMQAASLGLATCDAYLKWRTAGGYFATFSLRGKEKTRRTWGGTRAVDLELTCLSNALSLAVRRDKLRVNPIIGRGSYTDESEIVHCREKAPTPKELGKIRRWMKKHGHTKEANFTGYLAFSGVRIGEGLIARWSKVDWEIFLISVTRSKKGIMPWVPILPEMEVLLAEMSESAAGDLMFPSDKDATKPLDASAYRRLLAKACEELRVRHVTPHGLRSYFVTRAREQGFSDAEIAQLIGDKTGPSIIAEVYGDVLPEHLLSLARRMRQQSRNRLRSRRRMPKLKAMA